MSKIKPCLWFNGEAEAAAKFYVALFEDAAIGDVSRYGAGAPFLAGTAMMVEFTLFGQCYQALNGGPQFTHSEAISLSVSCKDRWGVSWQIVPSGLAALLTDPDPERRAPATQAIMGMKKLDLAATQAAADGV